jgi:16S rRNA (adenine1518-N6/adenine1519-N6)-dimethyltransferase
VTPPKQSLTFLVERLRQVGIYPKNKHGQNFLIDLNLQDMIVRSAELTPDDVVLEVGTGTGAITAMIAQEAGHVVTVEIDPQLYQLASEELFDLDNVTMLKQDALKNKNHFAPEVLAALKQHLEAGPNRKLKLVANLPYNIATPIISNLLHTDIMPTLMCVTIQKEVAERIVAKPNTKDYNALSIWVQCQSQAEIVRIMAPSVFWPRPKVDSAIIRIRPQQSMRDAIPDLKVFHTFVRAMFFHRRKFMRSVIIAAYKGRLDKPAVDEALAELQIGPNARSEQLDIPTMMQLCNALESRVPAGL